MHTSSPDNPAFRVLSAEFVTSVYDFNSDVPSDFPEVAFVGRSNVGKSSLLNAVCCRKSLAETSKMPGRTQAFNFFKIRFSHSIIPEEGSEVSAENKFSYLVDLPGYGYAQVSKQKQQKWPKMIESYLLNRESLRGVVLLMDCRRSPGDQERWIAELGKKGGLIVILTKADKIAANEVKKRRAAIEKELSLFPEQLLVCSTLPKKRRGIDQLTQRVCQFLTAP